MSETMDAGEVGLAAAGAIWIGQLYPSGGLWDSEMQTMAPERVRILTTRMGFRGTSLADGRALADRVEEGARLLADAHVGLIAFNCTAASIAIGAEPINRRIEAAAGIRSVTTVEAVCAALRAAKGRRLGLITPYPPEVVAVEIAFLAAHGWEVTAQAHHPCPTPLLQGEIRPEQVAGLAASLDRARFDTLLLSCAGMRLTPVIDRIEREIGRPVVASNQALLWHSMRLLGLADRVDGFGALLRGEFG